MIGFSFFFRFFSISLLFL